MKMKLKRHELIGLNNIFSIEGFSTCNMNADSAMDLVYLKCNLVKINEDADKIRKDFIKANTNSKLEELNNKEIKTEEEQILYNKLNTELNSKFIIAYTKYIEEEVEIDINKISKKEFKKLRNSNKDNNKIDLNNLSYLCMYIVDPSITDSETEDSTEEKKK